MESPFDAIARHLASNADVELRPLSRYPSALSVDERVAEFAAQASSDAALFLERYGAHLPAALLALTAEGGLGWIERRLSVV